MNRLEKQLMQIDNCINTILGDELRPFSEHIAAIRKDQDERFDESSRRWREVHNRHNEIMREQSEAFEKEREADKDRFLKFLREV